MFINSLNQLDCSNAKAVIFDCFGTLLEIKNKRHPFKKLLGNQKQLNRENYSHIMRSKIQLEDVEELLNIKIEKSEIEHAKKLLDLELSSVEIFDDVIPCLEKIKESNIKTLVCSNLATPYGDSLKLIPIEEKVLSYEVGYIKPEKEIYVFCKKKLGVDFTDILFVGDNLIADFKVPKLLGMKTALIQRA